ncbi:hypothetical protein PUN28_007293 [Cardiocondyla obscurior]|uniref:Cyclic AMP-dependent transcription factor ATF-2 n=1 Tax=Cardiocondyla obscurior TaxID=286306 RepID=A0AAW2G5F4_9HYME
MTDAEKLFSCTASGCSMSFANEDQLTMHKKKHDMMLNLNNNSKSAGFVDQTPTPTRFFKNCEEVGLFQDLQNVVNPFEETFRRAVEAGNTGTLVVSEAGITDDTLHTPHIFPYISDVLPANSQILSDDNVEICSSTVSLAVKDTGEESAAKTDECNSIKLSARVETQELMKDSTSAKDTLPVDIIASGAIIPPVPKLPPTQSASNLTINGEEVQLLLKTADGKLMQLCASPVLDTSSVSHVSAEPQTVVLRTEPALRCATRIEPKKTVISRLSLAKMKLKQSLAKSVQSERASGGCSKTEAIAAKRDSAKSVDQLKRKDLLERNRASSMRARAKRKEWIQDLQRTVTSVNDANTALQMEVKTLRKEVARLKTLLLAHRDCPVTKAMQKEANLESKVSLDSRGMLAVPANGVSRKRPVPNAEKKSTALPAKNPVIFPKVDCAANLAIIKALPALKIVNVNQFVSEKPEEARQIVIVQSQPRKLVEGRQIIQTNPNYEIEHAASKSTGT